MPQTPDFWGRALEQLPALVVSLSAITFILAKGMAFLREMTTTFVKHQEGRDEMMQEQLLAIGADCHQWAERRQEAMSVELKASREAMLAFTTAQAKHEQTMLRVAAALEHPLSP